MRWWRAACRVGVCGFVLAGVPGRAVAAEDHVQQTIVTDRALLEGCHEGVAADCRMLGDLYETGSGVVLKDTDRAHELYRLACHGGDRTACGHLK
jgi:TPR repeat protein